jgi:predicted extracellular nuclease
VNNFGQAMKHIIRFVVLGVVVALGIASNSVKAIAVGEQNSAIIIAEINPASTHSASEESIKLYNPNESLVDVTGWLVQYRSASHDSGDSSGWTTKAMIGCDSAAASCPSPSATNIQTNQTLLLATETASDGALPLISGMATTGGEVRLLRPKTSVAPEMVQDLVGYGTAQSYEGSGPASAPLAGRSIVRQQDSAHKYIDSNDNGRDFILIPSENEPGRGATGSSGSTYLDPEITEVFPDPASPQLDSADEFIELYNPYDESIDLGGYALKTGTTWSHSYILHSQTIVPHGYVALRAEQTHLSLSNSGSGVRLYDPNGLLLAEAPTYGKAQTGNSWVPNDDGTWVWTTTPTPGSQNIITVPTGVQDPKMTPIKKTNAKTASTSSKSKKPASSSKQAAGTSKGAVAKTASLPIGQGGGSNMWPVIAIGGAAVGYALYEYRREILGFVRRRWRGLHGAAE